MAPAQYRFDSVRFTGGGFVPGIVAHPKEPGLLYARTDVGGAYRFDAASGSWVPITDFIGHEDWRLTGVESVALDPSDPERVYLALGIYNKSELDPSAIARSTDRGNTFHLVDMPFGMGGNEAGRGSGERLAVDPHRGSRLLFGSRDRGLWQSPDHGASWSQVASFEVHETALPNPTPGRWHYLTQSVGIVFVLFDPRFVDAKGFTRDIYVAVSLAVGGWFRSRDAGRTFQPLPTPPADFRPIRAALASDGKLYAACGSAPGPNTMPDGAVLCFDTATDTWTDVTPERPEPEQGRGFGYASVAVDAHDPAHLLAASACRRHDGGDELFRSRDAGKSWQAIGQRGVRDASSAPWLRFGREHAHVGHWMYALVIDPHDGKRALYATGQTIWRSDDLDRSPTAWRVATQGIEETVPLALCCPPRGPTLLAGLGDISGFVVADVDRPETSVQMLEPTFKNTTGIDFAEDDPALVVRVGNRGWDRTRDVHVGAYSVDGGRHWRPLQSLPPTERDEGLVAVSKSFAVWLYSPARAAVFRSEDRGQSWAQCKVPVENPRALFSDRVIDGRFYLFARDEAALWTSDDGGKSFDGPWALPAPCRDAKPVFDAAGGLVAVLGEQLFRSQDGGRNFSPVATPQPVSHVAVGRARSEDHAPTWFIAAGRGQEAGFHLSADSGMSWQKLNTPEQRFGEIRSLRGDRQYFGTLYIATGGRGLTVARPAS
jgi:photosystem II stability/assembly factor-like uncharacterized protein